MKLKDVLHYYLGAWFETDNSMGQVNEETLSNVIDMIDRGKQVRLKLRRLSSMTEQEAKKFGIDGEQWSWLSLRNWDNKVIPFFTPEQFVNLTKAGFWLFGDEAFNNGEIIEL